jgi:hypothetical protein
VIWLQSPPWARWIISLLIAATAVWVEMRPDTTVLHPFAIDDIAPGSVIDQTNTEVRAMPSDALEPVDIGGIAVEPIGAGDPVLATDLGDSSQVVPADWWVIEIPLPRSARSGELAKLVLLDGGDVADGVVVTPAIDDPLGSGLGMVAVEPDHAADAARAAAEGRVAVMIAGR